MSNDALDGLVIVFIIAVMLTSTVLGYALARRGIEEDCALMNAFRIDARGYMCMQEYTYEDY